MIIAQPARLLCRRSVIAACAALMAIWTVTASPVAAGPLESCTGDCGGDDAVTIDELVVAVGIALGLRPAEACAAADRDGDGQVAISELIQAVEHSLSGCAATPTPAATRTATVTVLPSETPSPTVTRTPTMGQPLTVHGVCVVPGAQRRQPQRRCDAGVEVSMWRCDVRDRCIAELVARTRLTDTAVGADGVFELTIEAAQLGDRPMLLQAAVSEAALYQWMDLGSGAGSGAGRAAGGRAPIVHEVVIDASSEAALREIDARGFERFSDDEVGALIDATRAEAVDGAVYGGLSAADAAERGRLIAASALEPVAIAVAPDGDHVYTANGLTDSISAYRRESDGQLALIDTYRDGEGGLDGLDGAFDVAVNPSGSHVYAVGRYDNSIVVFSRDAASGLLTLEQVIRSVIAEAGDGAEIELLDVPYSLAVSPDDAFVYVRDLGQAGFLIELRRNPVSGRLSFDRQDGFAIRPRAFVGKRQLSRFAASGDARNVYIEHNDGDGILTLERDTSGLGGRPNPVQELRSADAGCNANAVSCTTEALGLSSVTGFASVQNNVYVASVDDQALNVFGRSVAQRGRLTRLEVLEQGVAGADGLDGPIGLTTAPDGRHVYVVAFGGNSVAAFARNTSTGRLTFVEALHDDQDGVDGLGGAFDVAASPDSDNVYVVSSRDAGVAAFERDPVTGTLSFLGVSE